MSTPDPFAYQGPLMPPGSGLSSQMFGWGGAPAGTEMTPFQTEYLDLMKQQNQPPSKWATGAQTFGSVAQGLAGLGNIYLGLQGMKQQKKAFEFNKGVINTNLGNAITDYNRRLGDTLANRALNNGQGQGWVSSQLQKYSATRSGG